jgi:hypothetical protein
MSPSLCRNIEFSDSSRFTFCCSNMSRRCTSKSLPEVSKNRRYAKSNACPIVSVISSAYNHHIEDQRVTSDRSAQLSLISALWIRIACSVKWQATGWTTTAWFLAWRGNFLFTATASRQDSAAHQASYSIGTGISLSSYKVARVWTWSLNSTQYWG